MKKKPEFKFSSPYQPAGDQPKAIKVLTKSILDRVLENESVKRVKIYKNDKTQTIAFEEIFSKVERAIQNIPLENGLPVDEAFNKVLNT